ncbi:MAG TPA: TonB-dependent receptor [Gemmatimonadales bacterium]|nr:TonB-dependent receptor [Gemmatimonadales bacterium]
MVARPFVSSLLALFALPALAASLAAQIPAPRDTVRPDSAVELPEIVVTVTRAAEPLAQVPAAVSVVGSRDLRLGQATLGLDEALNNVPGVYVANRYNFSLDQRLSIRGYGSRANFGSRGIKILLDGIPQTLPDGQSQLTNVEFGNLERIEVLRGASSSLYGNASGGVLSLMSQPAAPGPFSQSVRAEGGSFGLFKIQGRTTGRRGLMSGTLSLAHTTVDGFRQHSEARFTTLNLGLDYAVSPSTLAALRFAYTDAPKAENPGALTATEVRLNPDTAARANVVRGADKDVRQGQLAFTLRHYTRLGEWNATVFGFLRDLENPLATPPRSGAPFNEGTFVSIDRQAYGARLTAVQRFTDSPRAVRLTAGLDVQRMRDFRRNARTVSGVKDTLILHQRERVLEVGPFAQIHWEPAGTLLLSAGGRYDAVRFEVFDYHLSDGVDHSGERTMKAASGNLGLSWTGDQRFIPYVNISTAFETPTTTELANQPNSTGGFNTSLDPQRAVNYEAGLRGRVGRLDYSISGFLGRVRDAIVQYREVSGRAYFTNAGKLHNDGLEIGLSGSPVAGLRLFGSYTYADYTFETYRIRNGAAVDTLDGNRVPGVPRFFLRLGLRAGPVRGVVLDVDHTMAGSMYADDQNTQEVAGWGSAPAGTIKGLGSGVTNLRLSWEGRAGGAWVQPFLGVNNLWDREYVSAVTVNGTFGRVYEPAPGRNYYVGAEIGWAAR